MFRLMAVALMLLPGFRVNAQALVYHYGGDPIVQAESVADLADRLSLTMGFTPKDGVLEWELAAKKTLPFPVGVDVLDEGGPSNVFLRLFHRGEEIRVDLKTRLDAQSATAARAEYTRGQPVFLTDTVAIRKKDVIWNCLPVYWNAIGKMLDTVPHAQRPHVNVHLEIKPAIIFEDKSKRPAYTGLTIAPSGTGDDTPDAFVIRMTSATYDALRRKEKIATEKTWMDERPAIRLIPVRRGLKPGIKAYFSEFDEELASIPEVEVPEEYARREERSPKPLSDEEWKKLSDRLDENARIKLTSGIKKIIADQGLDPHGDEAKRLWKMLDGYR